MSREEKKCVLIIHNIRSAHNVGSLFRTADGAGVDEILLSGYSPVPAKKGALYLSDAEKALKKTALGAEESVPWKKARSLKSALVTLKKQGYEIVALEQAEKSIWYNRYTPQGNVALLIGNEVTGVEQKDLAQSDVILEIPMHGQKNSLNVSVASGIVLYHIAGKIKKSVKKK